MLIFCDLSVVKIKDKYFGIGGLFGPVSKFIKYVLQDRRKESCANLMRTPIVDDRRAEGRTIYKLPEI